MPRAEAGMAFMQQEYRLVIRRLHGGGQRPDHGLVLRGYVAVEQGQLANQYRCQNAQGGGWHGLHAAGI
ncbi:hypothetical protein VTN96DRAFT_6598 [Rasamsonia emersonii]